MLPHKHAVISATVGIIGWWTTREPAVVAVALIAGVLPDIDHLVDYAYYHWRGEHRLLLPLHGYEFALLGAVGALRAGDKVLGIGALSYLIHLLADQAENRTHYFGYSLLFRVWHRFRVEKLSTAPEAAIRGRMQDIDLLKSLLRRWHK
jgi:hypothetical protein